MNNYDELKQLTNSKSICIIGHSNPDADAYASMKLVKNFIEKTFAPFHIDMFAECNTISSANLFLLENDSVNIKEKVYDTCIMLDTPNPKRLGCFENLFNSSKLKCVIDHHATNTMQGDINIVEQRSSTCEVVYSIMKHFNYPISTNEKEKIYAGIITDTNNFTVGNFDKNTFDVVSTLIDEIDKTKVYNLFFANNSMKNMKMLSAAINNLESYANGQILFTHISKRQANKYNCKVEDFIGIINRLTTIENCKLVCFVYPKGDCYYVSMRAKNNFTVANLAQENGGGGHHGAAAFDSRKTLNQIRKIVLNDFNNQLLLIK